LDGVRWGRPAADAAATFPCGAGPPPGWASQPRAGRHPAPATGVLVAAQIAGLASGAGRPTASRGSFFFSWLLGIGALLASGAFAAEAMALEGAGALSLGAGAARGQPQEAAAPRALEGVQGAVWSAACPLFDPRGGAPRSDPPHQQLNTC